MFRYVTDLRKIII